MKQLGFLSLILLVLAGCAPTPVILTRPPVIAAEPTPTPEPPPTATITPTPGITVDDGVTLDAVSWFRGFDVVVNERVVYVAAGRQVVAYAADDLSQPLRRSPELPGAVTALTLNGDMLVVASGRAVVTLNLADFSVISQVETLPATALHAAPFGGAAAFALSDDSVVDAQGELLATFAQPITDLASVDGTLYAAAGALFALTSAPVEVLPAVTGLSEAQGLLFALTPGEVVVLEGDESVASVGVPADTQTVTPAGDHLALHTTEGLTLVDSPRPVVASTVVDGALFNPTGRWSLEGAQSDPYSVTFEPVDLAVSNEFAYVIDRSSLFIFDVSDLASPSLVSTYTDTPQCDNCVADLSQIAVSAGIAFLGASTDGVRALDLSNPAQPVLVQSFDATNGYADLLGIQEIIAQGRRAYLPALGGLYVLDVTGARGTSSMTRYDIPRQSNAFALDGSVLLRGRRDPNLIQFMDVQTEVVIGRLEVAHPPVDVTYAGGVALVATNSGASDGPSGHLYVIDASDTANPRVTWAPAVSGGGHEVLLQGRYALLTTGSSRHGNQLYLLDVSDVDSPHAISQLELPAGRSHVAVLGEHILIVHPQLGLTIYRVSH